MNERYKRYNAVTFEAYCKTAIDRAVNRGRRQKNRRAQQEISMSELSESMMGLPCEALEALTEERTSPTYFQVGDFAIPVHDEMLAKALLSLSPQRRSILLLAYFLDETDESIARSLNLSRSAVQRRRAAALELLRDMMGGGDR